MIKIKKRVIKEASKKIGQKILKELGFEIETAKAGRLDYLKAEKEGKNYAIRVIYRNIGEDETDQIDIDEEEIGNKDGKLEKCRKHLTDTNPSLESTDEVNPYFFYICFPQVKDKILFCLFSKDDLDIIGERSTATKRDTGAKRNAYLIYNDKIKENCKQTVHYSHYQEIPFVSTAKLIASVSDSLSENAQNLLKLLVEHLPESTPGKPETYKTYKECHAELQLEMQGKTYGQSLDSQGMLELAKWAKDNQLPAITGLVVNSKGGERAQHEPSKAYYTFHNKQEMDFEWWKQQITEAKAFNWSDYLSATKDDEDIETDDSTPTDESGADPASWQTSTHRHSPESTSTVDLRHKKIQQEFYKLLQERHKKVMPEKAQAHGQADFECYDGNKRTLYEIKTADTARQCIREAIGQLFEYGYWGNATAPSKIVVVGEPPLDAETDTYLKNIRKIFSIPIYYEQVFISE